MDFIINTDGLAMLYIIVIAASVLFSLWLNTKRGKKWLEEL